MRRLDGAGVRHEDVVRTDWGQFCFLWDPEGNPLQFYESAFIRPDVDPGAAARLIAGPARTPRRLRVGRRRRPSAAPRGRARRPRARASRATSRPSAAAVATRRPHRSPPPPSTLIADRSIAPRPAAGRRRRPPLEGSPEAAAESAGDATLAANAESLAVAIAADQPTGSFVVASVVQLRPGVFDEEFFRDWRDSYDEGVCAQAGGVAGNAQTEIDGRTVYIGTCAGGVHTYHVYLEGSDAIVSVNSVGEARLGEEVMENLPD